MFTKLLSGLAVAIPFLIHPTPVRAPAPPGCGRDNGLTLPTGLCAIVVAEGIGPVRHIVVAPNGDIYAALGGNRGGVMALRDVDGDGQAEVRRPFHDEGGTGIGLHGGYLWFSPSGAVLRWRLQPGELVPKGPAEQVVWRLPEGGHSAKSFTFLGGDTLIVNFGSRSNSCQASNRAYRSPGQQPCTELEERAGLWRFSTEKLRQQPADGARYATGLRNAMALAVDPATGKLFAAPHGRDQLAQNWGFSEAQNAELPAEEFVQVERGDDFGWPYCYYDQEQGKKVLAPEYGGDGRKVDRCAAAKDPLIGFPGHWGPMAIAFAGGNALPERYRRGALIAFHGSWNRAPLPQAGYRVVFAPFGTDGRPTGQYETFATGSAGPTSLRASGVAVGPDGSVYIANENSGTIYRVLAQ